MPHSKASGKSAAREQDQYWPQHRACVVGAFQVHISYLEIYNEVGYDLLDPNRDVKAMEDLPQVQQALCTSGMKALCCTAPRAANQNAGHVCN